MQVEVSEFGFELDVDGGVAPAFEERLGAADLVDPSRAAGALAELTRQRGRSSQTDHRGRHRVDVLLFDQQAGLLIRHHVVLVYDGGDPVPDQAEDRVAGIQVAGAVPEVIVGLQDLIVHLEQTPELAEYLPAVQNYRERYGV